jgi:EAL domain-containing protein (putative c-di-GMP-specific phosphodiesterase class I)
VKPAGPAVLIVDDDAQLGRLVAAVAVRSGFEARVALSAREAWLALDPEPALVLLDLNMPDADGLEVLRELASRRCASLIRVFSGTDPRILRSAAQLGRDFGLRMGEPLSKPVSVAELRDMFDELARAVTVDSPAPAAVPAGVRLAPPPVTADELRHGIRHGELFVVFQPILDLATLSPLGAEALVRWRHPVYGVVPPVQFVPLAESSGLAVEMTERIFALALEFAGRPEYVWAGRPLSISVNVAAAALIEFDLAALLAELLPAYGVSPRRLVVEVTESVMSADRTRVLEVLSRLRLRGVELSIDDFGTGTSSLERLDQFPFTELKIERAFIADLLRRPEAAAIASSTIELARRLDLRVVGEGIEDVPTLAWLRASGCSTGQGFLFARGLEEPDFLRWLEGWSERRTELLDASSP